MEQKRRILCYGDSNTWGFDAATHQRFEKRWTRSLHVEGKELEVIEEGLNGRNAVFKDPQIPEKCGFETFRLMLMSHKPLDVVIVMLGTNDLKVTYHASAKYIAQGLREYIRCWMNPTLYEESPKPQLLIVSPVLLDRSLIEREKECGNFDERSFHQSRALADEIASICEGYPCEFLDASRYALPGEADGLHLDEKNHQLLAKAISDKLAGMLADPGEPQEK